MEITGIIEEIVYRNEDNGFTVLELREEGAGSLITVVGSIPFASEGERVQVSGKWTVHPDYGEQLKVSNYRSIAPSTLEGMEKYLSSGLIKGVGPSTARKLVEHFGLDTLDIIQFNPRRLTEVPGIGPAKAELIASSFSEQKEVREVMLFLQTYGISSSQALRIYRLYGSDTVALIREDPYGLARDVTGIGFKTADRIARSMGVEHDSPGRIAAGIRYVLMQAAASGHTFLPREDLAAGAARLLGVEEDRVLDMIVSMALEQSLVVEDVGTYTAVYLPSLYYAETGICSALARLCTTGDTAGEGGFERDLGAIERQEGIILDPLQREAVQRALGGGVVVITGGPGTGKTTIINCIIKLLEGRGEDVVLTAPTGRAAKRMTEATGREARTIHRLLEYGFSQEDEELFCKDEDNPIEVDTIIVDEMSMVDVPLMYHLLKAVKAGTRLILAGDVDQLPSVGPGNVLKDIINSGIVPVVRLTEIFRQARESMIVLNAHRINAGENPVLNSAGSDFFLDRRQSPREIVDTLMDLVSRRIPGFGKYHPVRDIQVLSPMRKGVLGVNNLNAELQRLLNPPSPHKAEKAFRDGVFRQGDKVMQIRNNYRILWERKVSGRTVEEGQGIFNGDTGFIAFINGEDQEIKVVFDEDREVVYDFSQLDELELAYAVSVHKSQGSEFPVVIIPLAWGPPMLMTRNLLYTAVTRAREMVVIVGRERTIEAMVANDRITRRYSGLSERFAGIFAQVTGA